MKEADAIVANRSSNPTLSQILAPRLSRRQVVQGGLVAAGLALLGRPWRRLGPGHGEAQSTLLGFQGVAVSTADTVTVPEGYTVQGLYAWGDPISDGPAFTPDASSSAEEQALQAGMHHDGMHFFPLPLGSQNSTRGLLAVNHEYTDDGLLHVGGMEPWTAEKVMKSQAAHGVSIIEVMLNGDQWTVVRPSPYARRITGRMPIGVTGPAAGYALLQTAADPSGRTVLGTLNNCAHGVTPWGTYLTCEENFNAYFVNQSGEIPALQKRYGITDKGFGYRWHEHDERFDAARHPNEPNRFGWVVEIDPFDAQSQPVKHTTLGRFKHEGAFVTLASDNRAVVYMGDDERNEYIYKFVSDGTYDPHNRQANLRLLERGTLYVARCSADGTGEWQALVHGQNGLDAAAGFPSQAEVVINARSAADKVGATRMDRPEWIAVNAQTKEVYCTLTNNSLRGTDKGPATDAANPRANNVYGHIMHWREQGNDPQAMAFHWDVFVLCGDPANPEEARHGNIKGDTFGSPDGLWFDARGVLWIQTDISTSVLNQGDYANIGNNQMLAADVQTGEIRRFLTGPKACEVTGVVTTPDGKTMFVNIQHPGETPRERSDPAQPMAVSSWPSDTRPRSATVVIRKQDGGIIGS
jgi:hypothetical protein